MEMLNYGKMGMWEDSKTGNIKTERRINGSVKRRKNLRTGNQEDGIWKMGEQNDGMNDI
jgi:hypothetical protein